METLASATHQGSLASSRRGALLALGAILAAATVLRARGGWNDLWLDEIWSIEVAREVHAPLDVFTRLHHEINHYLNTLWLWTAGSHGNWLGYRVPSLVAGIGTVVLAGMIARRRGRAAVAFTMAVVSCSYVLVLYSSEVRGYAALVFFSFLSFLLLEAYLRRGDWRIGVAFSLAAILGLLSHLLFLSVLLSALLWCAFGRGTRDRSIRSTAERVALCCGLPWLCLAALYWVDIREIVTGGGGVATGSLVADYGTALAWALGAPVTPAAQLLGCILAVVVLEAGIRLVAREDRGTALFFAGAIVVFPSLLAVARDSPLLYTRHFIVPIAFLSLLLGFELAALWERGHASKWAAAVLFLAYATANGTHLRELFAHGRGQNGDALRFVLERSEAERVTIGADHDYRIRRVVEFYAQEGGGARIEYQPRESWQGAGPEWLIVNRDSYELPLSRGDQIHDAVGRRFDFVRAFPSAPLAGLHWFVYRNEAR